MAVTSKVLLRTQLATTAGAAGTYSVPSATTAIVTNISVANATATAKTFSISIGVYDSGTSTWTDTPLFSGVAIPANTTVTVDLKQVLKAQDYLKAFASVAGALYIHASGVEVA
jgi:hypothetical protein